MANIIDSYAGRRDEPVVRTLTQGDLIDALRKGLADFAAVPTHVIFVSLIYPIVGLLLFRAVFQYEFLPLLFPIIAGFALLGPFAAIGLYEISRLREAGVPVTWRNAVNVRRSRQIGAILLLGLVMTALFGVWLAAAYAIYQATFGQALPASLTGFLRDVLTTEAGVKLLVVGNLVGFGFAVVALAVSAMSFPMLVDRDVDVGTAISTSVRVMLRNPVMMLEWGAFVAAALVIGSLPLLVGLAVVMPVLGHATWHLYRQAVVSAA